MRQMSNIARAALALQLVLAPLGHGAELPEVFGAALGMEEAAFTATGRARSAPSGSADPLFAGAAVLDTSTMAEARGGFAVGGGVMVSFGFDIQTNVGGLPLQRLQLENGGALVNVTDYGAGGSATTRALGATDPIFTQALANDGLTRITTNVVNGSIAQAMVNQASGALIQRSAVVNLEISGMSAMLARRAQEGVLATALPARSGLGLGR